MTPQKRLFDVVLGLLMVVLLGPILLLVLVVLLVTSGRPLFYPSERMKTPDQVFTLWKLRTMALSDGPDRGVSGAHKAERITPMGRFLRKTRADELPQLWNVLRGDISFVGPRPPLREYVERFPELYREVLKSRPGVTGLATLRFHRQEEQLLARCHNAAETDRVYATRCVPRKATIDLIYQRNQSLCYDLKLIAMTFSRVVPK